MDKMKLANQLSRINNLIPTAPRDISKVKPEGAPGGEGAGSFKDALLGSLGNEALATPVKGQPTGPQGLKGAEAGGLKFSNHAIERMQTRGISYNPERMQKLDEAVKKAAAKGSKDTLVLMDDSALIVSVKNNTVVTVMDKSNLKENVFTNIDSTIVI